MSLTSGARLGPYAIVSALGAGGMGEVYRATDTRLDRTVAIKILPEALAGDPQFRERFDREARAISQLTHPHICTLYDIGESPNPESRASSPSAIQFLVMEYLQGETLEDRLAKGALPLDQALTTAVQIASALDKAHRAGIVHRDLKPGNIMLTKAGAKLLDFGLAKTAAPAVAGSGLSMLQTTPPHLTTQGTILGTFQYMAPEQLEGQEADARTDIFAFGAVLYEMITGKKAFEGKSHATMIASIIGTDPPPIAASRPLTPHALDRIVKKCLAKDPEQRWQSASDLADELKWVSDGGATVTIPTPGVARRRNGRGRLAWTVAALAVAALIVLAVPDVRREPVAQSATWISVLPPANAAFSADSAPAIAPDGRRLAFVAKDASGKVLLWVRAMDSLTAQPLAGTEEAQQPFWSPDSRALGFFSQAKLKRVDAAGGPPQTVCDISSAAFGGTWSSAGMIAFAPSSTAPVAIVSAAGGQPKPVTAIDRARQERGHSFPHFLPDGRHFVYLAVSAIRDNTGVYVGSIDSTDTKRLMNAQTEVKYAPPGYLLVVNNGSLVAQPFDTKRLELSGEPLSIAEQVVADPTFGDGMFSASENGTLAYRGGGVSGTTRLTWFDRDGTSTGIVEPAGAYRNPELSPDAKRVAVERRSAQGDRDLWLLDVSGAPPTRFTFTPADEYMPVWSPDGSRIVFASNRDASYGLYQKPSNGAGNEELLLKSPSEIAPMAWSPDGRSIVYRGVDRAGFTEVWVLPLFGDRKPWPLLQSGAFSKSVPQLSGNGRWLAYQTNETGRFEIYIQEFPTPAGRWQVSTGGGIFHRWSRDSKELFYLAPDQRLMAVTVKSGSAPDVGIATPLFATHTLGRARALLGFRQQYDVAPDGRLLMNVPVDDASAALTLVLNWTAGLKK